MITIDQYFGKWLTNEGVTEGVLDNAERLLDHVSKLMALADADNVRMPINVITDSQVSGEQYGGFRPKNCPIGAPSSAHKLGLAVDIFDPHGDLDHWINDSILEACGLYRESPVHTDGWCHLSIRAPHSGNRTFIP